jgi:DNA-directed RNA polymerase III subunit RPC6
VLWDANAIADGDEGMDNPKSKKRKHSSGGDDSSSDEMKSRRRKQGKKKSKRKHTSSSDDESSSDTDASRGMKSNNKAMLHSPSPIHTLFFDETDDGMNHVYRAVKQERVPVGWIEAPCRLCPSFDFCKEGGPVNPPDCTYYGDWLTGGSTIAIEDGI